MWKADELYDVEEFVIHVSTSLSLSADSPGLSEEENEKGKSADPSSNIQLAQVIEQAKKANMAVSSINDWIKTLKERGSGAKGDIKIYEVSGPEGSAFIFCTFTSNPTKTQIDINTVLRKAKASFSMGKVLHLFDSKSVIQTDFPANTSLEDAVNLAIELDFDDVFELREEEQSFLQFSGAPSLLNKFKTQLASRNYEIQSAELIYTPVIQVLMSDKNLEHVKFLYKKFQDYPEIVNIFDNVAWSEDS
ncbi:Translational activator of cytochrome c oxidase 1 [Gryllus bimaculatus]|nr:Translational activator of cytochrome c oxidase 1 [Gryllus bimaculatus]